MNQLPLHPAIVHLPLALAALLPLVGAALLVAILRNWLPRRAWAFAAALQFLLVGSGVLALRTGEADQERVERVVAEAAIEAHEEAAEAFVWAGAGVLVLALLPLLLRSSRAAMMAAAATTAGSLLVLGLGYRVGEAGGELVYRHGAAAAFATPASPSESPGPLPARGDDDDDDR